MPEQTLESSSQTWGGEILRTKLHPPPVAHDVHPRPQLMEKLDGGRQCPLTLISAPAGYGKSTLVSHWVSDADTPSAWLSLDEEDNDLRQFLRYVLAAIQEIFPEAGEGMAGLLGAPQLPSASILARLLLNGLDQIAEPFVLVLDDYHRVREKAVHDLVSELLAYPLRGFNLVLLSRRDPPLPIMRLRARGQLTEIRVTDLRFSRSEAAAFLERMTRVPIDENLASVLEEKTEGWVTGLRLVALSIQTREDVERMARDLRGDFRHITNYLLTEVISRQPTEMQTRMMEIALFDRFCAPLSDALQVDAEDAMDGANFIDHLGEAGLFVIALDEQHHWLRHHHLFQQFLQDQLAQHRSPEEVADLHRRGSRWFEESGLVDEAIRHSLLAGDVTRAAELVEESRDREFQSDRWYHVERRLFAIPLEVRRNRPTLVLTEAWIATLRHEMERVPTILDQATQLLQGLEKEPTVTGELSFFHGYSDYMQGEGLSSAEHLEKAVSLLYGKSSPFWGESELMLGLARCMNGQKELAVSALTRGILEANPSEGQLISRKVAGLVFIHMVCGDLPKVQQEAQRLLEVAKQFSMDLTGAWGEYMWGWAHLQSGQLSAAADRLSHAEELKYILEPMAALDAMTGLSLTQQFAGHPHEARATSERVLAFASELNGEHYVSMARSCRARLDLLQGDPDSALAWARSTQATPDPSMLFVWLGAPAVTQARVLVVAGDEEVLARGSSLLQKLRLQCERCRFTCQRLEIAVLQSLLLDRQGDEGGALQAMQEAVAMAEPGGWMRPFMEAGLPAVGLLELLVKQDGAPPFAERVLATCSDLLPTLGLAEGPKAKSILTRRETELLPMLADGMSNKEIARSLHISTETVKRHVYNMYRKLDVDSRIIAISKARALGILSDV